MSLSTYDSIKHKCSSDLSTNFRIPSTICDSIQNSYGNDSSTFNPKGVDWYYYVINYPNGGGNLNNYNITPDNISVHKYDDCVSIDENNYIKFDKDFSTQTSLYNMYYTKFSDNQCKNPIGKYSISDSGMELLTTKHPQPFGVTTEVFPTTNRVDIPKPLPQTYICNDDGSCSPNSTGNFTDPNECQQNCTKADYYKCVPGIGIIEPQCVSSSKPTPYRSQKDCEDICLLPYKCTTGFGCGMVMDGSGTYSTEKACEQDCKSYNCDNYTCTEINDKSGRYKYQSDCVNDCTNKYSCDGRTGTCFKDALNGSSGEDVCQKSCKKAPPPLPSPPVKLPDKTSLLSTDMSTCTDISDTTPDINNPPKGVILHSDICQNIITDKYSISDSYYYIQYPFGHRSDNIDTASIFYPTNTVEHKFDDCIQTNVDSILTKPPQYRKITQIKRDDQTGWYDVYYQLYSDDKCNKKIANPKIGDPTNFILSTTVYQDGILPKKVPKWGCNTNTYQCEVTLDGKHNSLQDCLDKEDCQPPKPPPSPGHKFPIWAIILIVVAVLSLVVSGAIWYHKSNNKDTRRSQTTSK